MFSIRIRPFVLFVVLTLVFVSAAAGERAWPPIFDFERPELLEAWCTQAAGGILSITEARANVRSGRGALELNWTPADGRLAIVSAGPVRLDTRPRSLRLSVKVSETGPIMYGVRDASGGSYQGYLYAPADAWHDIAVSLSELMLSECSDDEHGRLDVNQITGLMVADLSNLGGEAGRSLGTKSGAQRLWLDNVELSGDLAPRRSRRGPDGELIIDDFNREPIHCLPIGSPLLELVPAGDGGDDERALRITYDRAQYRWAGFVTAVGYLDLTRRSAIYLRVKADQAVPLTVVLEERDGSKYQVVRRLDPEEGWHTLRLPFDRFTLDRHSEDVNEQLDLDQLRVIIPVVDAKRAEVDEDGVGAWSVARIWVK